MSFLSDLGLFSIFSAGTAVAVRPLVAEWIRVRIAAGVEEAVKKRLAVFQLDVDKDLEVHRAALGLSAERIRSSLARDATDFAIYAARRHDAIANLFAAFLHSEDRATSFRDLAGKDAAEHAKDLEVARTNQVVAAHNEAYEAYYRHVLYLPDDVEVLALEVCYAFHKLLGEYVAPHADHFVKQGEARDMLSGSMVKLQHAARAELARAKPE